LRLWPLQGLVTAGRLRTDHQQGDALTAVRATIHDTVWQPKLSAGQSADGHSAEGQPDEDDERPYPGEGEPTPAECPQVCIPDTVTPKCPQSCDPFPTTCEPDDEPKPEEETVPADDL